MGVEERAFEECSESMTDRHTKILLWAIAIGVWANVVTQNTLADRNVRLIRILDNIDGNLAWANTHLKAIRESRP
jgi:hypothetical protein